MGDEDVQYNSSYVMSVTGYIPDEWTDLCGPATDDLDDVREFQAKQQVEAADGYLAYVVIFMLGYFAVTALCLYTLWTVYKQQDKFSLSNNRLQVITFLAVGSFVRAFSFIPTRNCVAEGILRCLKDVLFVVAFTLIVLFWVELQKYVRQMQTIKALRPALLTCIASYTFFRVMVFVFEIAGSGTGRNVFRGLTIMIYLGVVGVGLVFGLRLLKKMKSMKKGNMKARLAKLTYFIILEVLLYGLFLIVWTTRQLLQKQLKTGEVEDEWTNFWFKFFEKIFELASQLVLCLTMTTSSKGKEPSSGGRPASVSDRASNGGASGARGGTGVRSAHGAKKDTINPLMKDGEGQGASKQEPADRLYADPDGSGRQLVRTGSGGEDLPNRFGSHKPKNPVGL